MHLQKSNKIIKERHFNWYFIPLPFNIFNRMSPYHLTILISCLTKSDVANNKIKKFNKNKNQTFNYIVAY